MNADIWGDRQQIQNIYIYIGWMDLGLQANLHHRRLLASTIQSHWKEGLQE